MKRPSASGAAKRKKDKVDKGLRALRKGIVHLTTPSGRKQQFKDETRKELLSVLSRIRPSPPSKSLGQMIAVAERVVTDLTARRKDEEESDPDGEVRALRRLLGCAKEMREACGAVFDNKFLRNSLKVPLLAGVIMKRDRKKHSEEDIRKVFKYLISDDLFDKFGKGLVIYLDGVIKGHL